jgi:hypothetical protein
VIESDDDYFDSSSSSSGGDNVSLSGRLDGQNSKLF